MPGQYRIEHPSRPDAYQPVVRHNGEGAWHTELEQPLEWDGETVLRRIGSSVESLSPNERETVLRISGTSEDALRKMHVNQEKVPPLLADSIQRFKIDQQLQRFIDQLDSHVAEEFLRADPVTQLQVLSEYGRWPSDKCLRLLDRQGQQLWQSSADTSLPVTELRQDSLVGDDVLKTLLYSLDETQIKALLNEPFAGPTLSIEVRSQNLRKQVADLAKRNRSALFETRYQALQHLDDPLAARLKAHPPELPASITRELLDTATGSELLQINEGQLPARQQALMQMASQEVRVTRAYEGLELDSVSNSDSDSLALHSLKLLPGWSGDVRIEIRDRRYEGPLLDTIGREDAAAHKVLVRRDDGQYQPYDDRGQQLHSFSDFYSSLLYALPDSERQNLDIRIGQGQALKATIRERTLERNELRQVIGDTPTQPSAVDTLRLLGTDGYPLRHHVRRAPVPNRAHSKKTSGCSIRECRTMRWVISPKACYAVPLAHAQRYFACKMTTCNCRTNCMSGPTIRPPFTPKPAWRSRRWRSAPKSRTAGCSGTSYSKAGDGRTSRTTINRASPPGTPCCLSTPSSATCPSSRAISVISLRSALMAAP